MKSVVKSVLLLISMFSIISCQKEEVDIVSDISVSVSSETGIMYPFFDSNKENPIECMLVMTEDDPGIWQPLEFNRIEGFVYERGHEYELRVMRTLLANPPMDAPDRTYKLKSILSDKLVVEPEVPIEEEIKSEDDIVYEELCPFEKYAIWPHYFVDSEGNIFSDMDSPKPSYEHARIYLENVLSLDDPNWVKFQKVTYQATYSYVLSPLTEDIRLVRNESSGPMFKNVIPEDEFNHITQSMQSGEELKYTLILANVHKKGLQRVEFIIVKK